MFLVFGLVAPISRSISVNPLAEQGVVVGTRCLHCTVRGPPRVPTVRTGRVPANGAAHSLVVTTVIARLRSELLNLYSCGLFH
jgi:hypothetical protein